MNVADAVRHELSELPDDLRESGIAAVAVALAERIDAGKGSPSECGKVVLDALTRLRDLSPPKQEKTKLDDLTARRRIRLAGAAASKA